MKASSAAIAAILLVLASPSAEAQQPRAPAGGMYVNGHFYKGGQFIPGGAGGYAPGPMFVDPGPAPTYVPPSARRKARLAARSSARTDYRSSARADTSVPADEPEDPERLARARIEIARKLIAAGKAADAKGWLQKVIRMKASDATIAEARKLLASLK